MAIKKGLKVVIAKNLGPKNRRDIGDEDDYYFSEAETTSEIKLGTKGTVSRVEGNKIHVTLEDTGDDCYSNEEFPFHKDELKFPGKTNSDNPLGRLPPPYVFSLASQMPIFLINDRVYSLEGSQRNLRSNFFQVSDKESPVRRKLVESATLASLEELTRAHQAENFARIEKKYLQEVIEERNQNKESDRYKLVDFIVNEVFPYFRGDGQSRTRIGRLLGVGTAAAEDGKGKFRAQKPKKEQSRKEQSQEETLVSKLIDRIEKERFQRSGDEERKKKKLNSLLGYDSRWDVADFPPDYEPTSLLGQILAGRNIALVDNLFYNLVWTNSDQHRRVLNLDGKNFALVSPKPMDELTARYNFELSKRLRVGALREKLAQDGQLRSLTQRNTNLRELVRKEQYDEGGFGFVKDDNYAPGDYYTPGDTFINQDSPDSDGSTYLVFLDVPAHVLKQPGFANYYYFKKVRVAVPVFVNDQGNISYHPPISLDDTYMHPFIDGDHICLGEYPYEKLCKLKKGEAVARLLVDTRSTIHSGYMDTVSLLRPLDNCESNIISLDEVERRGLPITNINLERGG